MHRTGTQAGDSVEVTSASSVFAPFNRGLDYSLYLGSVKVNVGQSDPGSENTSPIRVLEMMEENAIMTHCALKSKINTIF